MLKSHLKEAYNLLIAIAVAALPAAGVVFFIAPEYRIAATVVATIALGIVFKAIVDLPDDNETKVENPINEHLKKRLGGADLSRLHVYRQTFPLFRFVDLFEAVCRFVEAQPGYEVVESENPNDLNSILSGQFYSAEYSRIKAPQMLARDVAFGEQRFYPTDRFWLRARPAGEPATPIFIIRFSCNAANECALDVAADSDSWAEESIGRIVADSVARTIFRNRLLQVSFGGRVRDEAGDIDTAGEFRVEFKDETPVRRQDIVLDPEVESIIDRNFFSFVKNRNELIEQGIPGRRGVLFYGPPGTGKTYTCRYIAHELKDITTIVAGGSAAVAIRQVCGLARLLQPCLLVLEDVDLAFSAREINPFNTSLGDLLDEMDGFQHQESVLFLLTTNAIERLEPAIKERPGRISQCVFFGHPDVELRTRYLEQYLKPYDATALPMEDLVELTEDTSQAFLKELVFRAVQVALEDPNRERQPVRPEFSDFQAAMDEITRFDTNMTRSIVGFRVER